MVIVVHLLYIGKSKKKDLLFSIIIYRNNCKRESLKLIRSYYSKPYFLPPSVSQTLMGNWFLVSSGFDKDKKRLHSVSE
jgi:hypothetical protein